MAASYRFVVRGLVQGVFFRQSTVNRARELGLSGWVRNLSDGRVDGIAAGPEPALDQLRAWLQHGPPEARVESVEWTAVDEQPGPGGFGVRR